MASDNLMVMEQPWTFRPASADACIADIFAKETDTLTKALQKSISMTSAEMVESLFAKPKGSKQRRSMPPSGRVAKRKSNRAMTKTSFVTADPANFRRMVQQVTGDGQPQRAVSLMQQGSALPTFGTSARLLDGSAASLAGIISTLFAAFRPRSRERLCS